MVLLQWVWKHCECSDWFQGPVPKFWWCSSCHPSEGSGKAVGWGFAPQLAAVLMQNAAASLSLVWVKQIQSSSLQQDWKPKLLAALNRIGLGVFSGFCGNNCHLLVFSVMFLTTFLICISLSSCTILDLEWCTCHLFSISCLRLFLLVVVGSFEILVFNNLTS